MHPSSDRDAPPAPPLAAILEAVWHALAQAPGEPGHGFRLPVLATQGLDGRPAQRTVVLRAVETESRRLRFFADARSRKIAEIAAAPEVGLLFLDLAARVQLRAWAEATVHAGDALSGAAWPTVPVPARRLYALRGRPGTPLATDGEDDGEAAAPAIDEASAARNFAVVDCRVTVFDWYHFPEGPHRRARFTWNAESALGAAWLVP